MSNVTISRKLRLAIASLSCTILALPAVAGAQRKSEDDRLVRQVLWSILGPDWNLFANAGLARNGRYLLQQSDDPALGQRALRGNTGFGFGVGAGVDILLNVGWRVSYNFSSTDLEFRTDNGNRSRALDVDDLGSMRNHIVGLEVVRYMFPSTSVFTPYATLGLLATWWNLDDDSPFLLSGGGSTQFRWGALANFGMQGRVADHWRVRLEAGTASVRNPFTGHDSFRVLDGLTIDEPTRVSRLDLRLGGVYSFGKPDMPSREEVRERVRERVRDRNRR